MEDPSFQQQVQQIMMNAQLQQQQEQEQALPTELPPDYSPGPYDICCGRGKRNWNHTGNKAFRELIQSQVDGYVEAGNKTAKTAIVVSIVDQIRHMGAHFLKQDTGGRWYDIGDKNAREKVGHSLRDQVTAARQRTNKERAAAAATASVLTAANLNQHQQLYHHQQQQQLEQQQHQNHHQPHQPSRNNNAGVTDSWLHAVTDAASRPSEVWSDFGGEEELRRSTLETTPILEKFGRRPSWLAMSFVDAAANNNNHIHPDHHHHHTTASTLQQAATQATVDVHQQEEMMMMPDAARCESGPHIVIPPNAAPLAGSSGIPGSVLAAPLREAAVPEEAAIPQAPQDQAAYHHHQQPQPVINHMNAAAHDPPPPEANTSGMMVPPQQQPQPVPSDTLSGAVAVGGAAAAADDDDDAPEQGEDDDRRASAISLMSLMDLPEDMFRMSFANAFRSSMRRSSMSWVTNSKDMRATRTSLVGLDSAGSSGGLPW